MRITMIKIFCLLLFPMLAASLVAQAKDSLATPVSIRAAVQEFYDWYVPKALSADISRAWELTFKDRSSNFSPELSRLLKEDSDAQAKCSELVGLDWDPILSGQNPAEHYEVGNIRSEGAAAKGAEIYRADVFRVESGEKSPKPDVTAEFVVDNESWYFVNFYYHRHGKGLLTILRLPLPKCSEPKP